VPIRACRVAMLAGWQRDTIRDGPDQSRKERGRCLVTVITVTGTDRQAEAEAEAHLGKRPEARLTGAQPSRVGMLPRVHSPPARTASQACRQQHDATNDTTSPAPTQARPRRRRVATRYDYTLTLPEGAAEPTCPVDVLLILPILPILPILLLTVTAYCTVQRACCFFAVSASFLPSPFYSLGPGATCITHRARSNHRTTLPYLHPTPISFVFLISSPPANQQSLRSSPALLAPQVSSSPTPCAFLKIKDCRG
jgi:hypothetical protein